MALRHPIERRLWWGLRGYRVQGVLDFLEESQWWPRPKLDALRDSKLRTLIRHCWEHVPYYRRIMEQIGVEPRDFSGVGDLPKLPVLTKDIIREQEHSLLASNIPVAKMYRGSTGGTTGEPVHVWHREEDKLLGSQCYVRGLAWAGLGPGTRRVKLFGGSLGLGHSPFKKLAARLLRPRTMLLPAFELTASNVSAYVDRIRRFGAKHLLGYASAVYLFAVLVEAAGLRCKLDAVFTTAEMLHEQWAETIGRVFHCKVVPYYGCGEVNSLAFICPDGGDYHTADEHVVIEVLKDGGECGLDGEGAFVITDLDNYAMPLLRYCNGDEGVLAAEPCGCGRSLGRMVRIKGRTTEYLLSKNGDRISGTIIPHVFRLVKGVTFYQVVLEGAGDVRIRIVASEDYDPSVEEAKLRYVFRKHLGEGATVEFEYVDSIERASSGKLKLVVDGRQGGL